MAKNTKRRNITPKKKQQQGKHTATSRKNPESHTSIEYVGKSDRGKVRKNNEDNLIKEELWGGMCFLAAAIDGLGGYEGGELAAKIAGEKIVEYLKESNNGERIELLKQAVTFANNAIYDASQNDERYFQMGCVLTSAIIDVENRLLYMVHVGDSRLYSFHDGELKKLSHDHSLVGYREEIGDLTEEQAMNHPNRNIVDRVIGHERHLASDNDFIEAATFALEPKTIFLFCSDGLTDMITSATIAEVLGRKCSLTKKQDALIQAALDAGGKDNVTVVLVEYFSEENILVGQERKEKSVIDHDDAPISGEVPSDSPPQKNELKKPIVAKVICFVLGLLAGFLFGYGIGSHHNGQEITTEGFGTTEPIVIDSCSASQLSTTDILDSVSIDTLISNNSELQN